MRILLCLASQPAAANLNSLKDIKADKVLLAITQEMLNEGESLIHQIKQDSIQVEKIDLHAESSLKMLTQQFEQLIEKYIDDEIIVNITGGNKLMSIAAYQIFSGYGFRCFYQNLKPNQLVWLDDETTISDIGFKISLERYLKSYQFDVVKKQKLHEVDQNYKKYAHLLYQELSKAGRYQQTCQLVSKLNAHAAKPKLTDLKHFSLNDDEESFLTHLSYETDLFKLKANTIEWQTEQDRAFIAGGWIEYLTASLLTNEKYRDISLSVEIAKSTQRIKSKHFKRLM